MIYTVTLSPALDRTLTIPGFTAGRVNRVESVRLDPGGKGINVSKNLLAMGVPNRALGLLGGDTGERIEAALKKMGLETDFVPVSGETRTNTKIFDPESGETTDLNEKGPEVLSRELEALRQRVRSTVHGGDTVIFSGSLPQGAPETTWRDFIHLCRSKGAKTYLDTSGPALKEALEARPYLIKPNLEELSFLTGRTPDTAQSVIADARTVALAMGSTVVASMGGDGAVMVRGGPAWFAKAPAVQVASSVGAGDALVAGLVAAEENGLDERDQLAFAVAAGSAAAVQSGSRPVDMSDVLYLSEQVRCAGVVG